MNSLEKEGVDAEEGINILKILASWVKNLNGEVFGSNAAKNAESLIHRAMAETAVMTPAGETATRLIALMIKKNKIHYADAVIEKAEELLNKKRGVVTASVEYAFAVNDATESRIREEIIKRTGASRVNLTGKINTDLIGGYRLRIGDEVIDASVRSQLRKLLDTLQSGQADGGI
ncbi:MAG: ATP synthase F1 subunit delta [Treponema sp.]|nr:ATP synthase F1 subunit delta [Treponema sp.]